jgi:hypothetical protein
MNVNINSKQILFNINYRIPIQHTS